MAIITEVNPRTKQEITMVEGEVTGVYFNEIKNKKSYKNGFTPTHVVAVKVDGKDSLSLGMTDKPEDGVRCKDVDGNYHTLALGMKINAEVKVTQNGEFTNYNAFPKDVLVQDATVKEQPKKQEYTGKKKGGYKKDNSGIECGHALNGAMNLLNGKMTDPDEYLELAKQIHDITVKVKAKHKENNPDLDDYAVGASAGNAVLNSCTLLTKTKIDQVEEKALSFLDKFSTPLLSYIRGEDKVEEEEQEEAPEVTDAEGNTIPEDAIPF